MQRACSKNQPCQQQVSRRRVRHGPCDPLNNLNAAFARFMRLDVANGDAWPHTIRGYRSQLAAWVSQCANHAIDAKGGGHPKTTSNATATTCFRGTAPTGRRRDRTPPVLNQLR
jgi:hypothetical protein